MDESPATKVLLAMNLLGKPMYEGTVPPAEKVRRRVKGKLARAARRANR